MKKTKVLDGIIAFVVAVVIILFVNALLFQKLGIAGMGVAEALLLAVPLMLVFLRRENISERFNLKLPSIGSFFSAVVLMMGANMWENAASFIYVAIFGMPEQNDMVFLESFFSNVNPAVALVIIALIPAVCEELLFRGYIFSSFKGKRSKVVAVMISSILFSLIHFDAYKTIPILIMALAFGYITAKTDSVLIPMIFHFINNSMAVISFYAMRGQDTQAVTDAVSSATYIWYAIAAFGGGLVLVYFGSRLLSGKPRKKVFNILVPILSGVLFTVGVIGLVLSMISMPYSQIYSTKVRKDTVHTETFTIEEDTAGFITVTATHGRSVTYTVTVTDPHGEEIYCSDDTVGGYGIAFEKGEYTVTYAIDVDEERTETSIVNISVDVVTSTALTVADTEDAFGSV